MFSSNLKNHRGIGLLELMLAIVIIAAMIILAIRYYQSTRLAQKQAATISLVGDIHQAAMTYVKRKDYSGSLSLDNLKSANLLTESQSENPWGGSLTVSSNNNQVNIEFTNVPSNVCFELQNRLSKSARFTESVVCSGTTLDVNYDAY